MASVCFVYVCDVHHVDTRMWICFWRISGETTGKGTPSPFQGRATVRLPPSKFFIFFHPIPIISPIHPFFLPLRGFLFLCVYFPIRVSFCVSEGKKRLFLSYLCLCGYYALYSHSLLFPSVVFFCCVFLLYLPIVLLSVLCSCIVFCCGCCVFR